MRMGKGMVVGLLCLVLVFAICLPSAKANILNGAWFKMKLTAKGYKWAPNTDPEKYNFSAPVYLHLTWFPPNNVYRIYVWTLDGVTWRNSFTSSSHNTLRPEENFFSNLTLIFRLGGTDLIVTHHSPFISYKMNGAVLQAKWQGTGEVFDGSFESGAKEYFGYFNLTGQTVAPAKLPDGIPH